MKIHKHVNILYAVSDTQMHIKVKTKAQVKVSNLVHPLNVWLHITDTSNII